MGRQSACIPDAGNAVTVGGNVAIGATVGACVGSTVATVGAAVDVGTPCGVGVVTIGVGDVYSAGKS